ncbi:MAG: sensor histidine kinase [Calditrichia bacterium]
MKIFKSIFTGIGRFFRALFTKGLYFPVWLLKKIVRGLSRLGKVIWQQRSKIGIALLALAFFLMIANAGEEGVPETILALIIFGVAAFLIVDRFIQRRKVKQLHEMAMQAELHMLRTQINPHFFFNTLNNLYGLTVEKSDKAPEVILKLSDIMRYTIYEGEKDLVPVEADIAYLENYIELNKIRHHKKVDISFSHMVEDPDCKLPPLLLIMLVENAFKHGAETLIDDAFIHMQLMVTTEQVYFEISNNFDPTEKGEPGIGLKNLRRRLELLYPDKHSLQTKIENTSTYKASLKLFLS